MEGIRRKLELGIRRKLEFQVLEGKREFKARTIISAVSHS